MWYKAILDRGLVPDGIIRLAIRRRCAERLRVERARFDREAFVAELKTMPVALHTDLANEQHYEVPPAFFALVLGPRRKYSCALFPQGVTDLAEAEERMLALTAERAGIADGQRILDLGCGWGSFSLRAAERYPKAQLVAVSNSRDQGAFIRAEAARRGLKNLEVLTADVNDFAPEGFDSGCDSGIGSPPHCCDQFLRAARASSSSPRILCDSGTAGGATAPKASCASAVAARTNASTYGRAPARSMSANTAGTSDSVKSAPA